MLSVKVVVKLGSNLNIYLLPIVFVVKQIKAVNTLKGQNYLVT